MLIPQCERNGAQTEQWVAGKLALFECNAELDREMIGEQENW